ncbi:MAG: tetratricopeptide repeat protein [Chloroflexi bacterium]|nr:tetratricopeptide repeat protein [Chloroflexota bacterium]
MDNLITRTKVIPPRRRTDLLSRPRMLDTLNELIEYKLLFIVAPAGYGKTVLLVDFAHTADLPVCWYAIDLLDQDAYRFFAHFIAAITQRFPDFGHASMAALQSMTNNQGTVDQLVTMMVNELYEHIREHFVLVIDDYHLIDSNDVISNFISQFVQQVDENCHIILTSRKLLSVPNMALLIARGYVGGLDFEDLSFAKDEIQRLVLQNYDKVLTDSEAEALVKATEGWITGLLLSAQSKLRNISGRMRVMRAAGINLYDYLIQQVLEQQPPFIRNFLLRTSVLGEFDAAICQAIFEPKWQPPGHTWETLLAEISQRNLFVLPVGEDGTTLRYHHLFQDFLQKQLAEEHPTEEAIILERLATVYMREQAWEKAHQLYQRLANRPAIADLIEQAGQLLLNAGRVPLLASWLADLPEGFINTRSALLSIKGEVLSRQGEVAQALRLFNQAEQGLHKNNDTLHLSYTLVRRAVAHRFLGDYQASVNDADQVLQLIEKRSNQPPESLFVKALALRCKGFSLRLEGELSDSINFLEQALEAFQALDDQQNRADVLTDIAVVHSLRGHNKQARPLFQAALDIWRTLTNVSAQATVLNNLGVLLHQQGDYVQALKFLEEARLCAERSGYTRLGVFALTSLGDIFFELDMWAIAQSFYSQALNVAQQINEHFVLLYLELALARVASANDDWEQAFDRLNAVSKMVLDRKSSYEWGFYQLAMGRHYFTQGKADAAIEPLIEAQGYFAKEAQPTEEANIHFFLAGAWQTLGNLPNMQTNLAQGLSIVQALENRHPLVTTLRVLKDFLRTAPVQEAALNTRLKRLVSEITAFEQSIPTLSRQLRQTISPELAQLFAHIPPKLVIRAFGRAEVIVDGKLISSSEWQTQAARDLFFCLLAHPAGLTKEQVGTLFWPDAAPSELRTRFKNTMYRLRSALNQEVILFEDEIYRFNRVLDYEYDLENFLRKVEEGDIATDPVGKIAAYAGATQIYRGHFLPDVDATWVWAEREHLQQIFIETSLTLAELQLEARDHHAALASCQRILLDDPCLEDAHRLVMRIHAATGNRSAIARQYAQCERALLDEIDAPPSPQTTELFALLMR